MIKYNIWLQVFEGGSGAKGSGPPGFQEFRLGLLESLFAPFNDSPVASPSSDVGNIPAVSPPVFGIPGLTGLSAWSHSPTPMYSRTLAGQQRETLSVRNGKDSESEESDKDSILFEGSTADGILVESLALFRQKKSKLIQKSLEIVNCNFPQAMKNSKSSSSALPPSNDSQQTGDFRKGQINVEWIDQQPQPQTFASVVASSDDLMIPFVSGYTEVQTGILHLLRVSVPAASSASSTSASTSASSSASAFPFNGCTLSSDETSSKVLCVLAVPSYMTPADFLQFMGAFKAEVTHYRLIRDSQRNKFMVLLKFKEYLVANEFLQAFNGQKFSAVGAETCHVVRIHSIQTSSQLPYFVFPALNEGDPSQPEPTLAELPTCPVCLERMDASVSGLLTTLCHHTFHCTCLSKWPDSTCPVCRYNHHHHYDPSSDTQGHQGQEDGLETSLCQLCSTTHNLWICLICGHVGCGRYQRAHAYSHFLETSHLYAMEMETQRVWDYAGDGYVHRLIQTKSDGKLVELPPSLGQGGGGFNNNGASGACGNKKDKLDDLTLEFTHLLTSSLETQRMHFEMQLEECTKELTYYQHKCWEADRLIATAEVAQAQLVRDKEDWQERAGKLESSVDELKSTVNYLQTENRQLSSKLVNVTRRFEEEEAFARQMASNQPLYEEKLKQVQIHLDKKDSEIVELQEQLRDLMIFLDARDKLENATEDDLKEGKIVLASASTSSSPARASTSSAKKSKQRRKK